MNFTGEKVQKTEQLYRVVKRSQPDALNAEGKPTSALFKQDDGVSVDRDGGRLETIIIDRFKKSFNARYKGLTKVVAKVCLENDMAVIPAPTENPYHAEIFENVDKEPLSQLKALILADNAEVIDYEPKVKWVGK